MSAVRNALLSLLAPLPPALTVIAYARDLDITSPVVMLRLDDVRPGPQALVREYLWSLVLVTPKVDSTGPADDELDQMLEDVLYTLDQSPGATWARATRGVYADRHPAYEVSVTIRTTHTRGD